MRRRVEISALAALVASVLIVASASAASAPSVAGRFVKPPAEAAPPAAAAPTVAEAGETPDDAVAPPPPPRWCHGGEACNALAHLAPAAEETAVELIYFRADWCPNCVVLERQLTTPNAELGGATVLDIWAADGGVRLHVVDLTEPEATTYDALVDEIVARGLAKIYNGFLGITGFIAVIAPGGEAPALCLARVHAPVFLADWPLQVADKVRAKEPVPPGDDGFCPPRRNPPPM